MRETIHALATAPGRAGIAVLRVSGPAADAICAALVGRLPPPRLASRVQVRDADGALIDEALALRFEEGASFTGEPVLELHLHGGPAIVRSVTAAVAATGLARPAEPGEFTRRALEAGRMDLTQVHGLADALEAETERQRVAAMRRLSGETGARFRDWRRSLVEIAARLEATVDFADEDLPADVTAGLAARLAEVAEGLEREVAGFDAARALRDGFEVAVIGPPNVGKSSLINVLSGRDTAIVSDVAGTTRDVLEARLDVGGFLVTVLDTAGLRETGETVERIGVARARERAEGADLRIHVSDRDTWDTDDLFRTGDIRVRSKSDLGGDASNDALPISTRTGDGITPLLARIEDTLSARVGGMGEITRTYEREAFERGARHLRAAAGMVEDAGVELVLDEIYVAIRAVDQVIGTVDVESLLGEIFSSFCIGK
ncbi:tRNA uridine-5-carboxymethylaminomethyl(34) synthesis GTPase MnmE [Jannaschia sp. W003]|uniref:tRNA uridine-5-carboxymethylaminomethyl(34) synthesis GTPase MnmE n=1 Tax=Jannaschia sp. W003 TaxID=2867012 RepID=UPI0021A432BA|nr:tRNA uridine-5-carboxymethylaminomethyl(34) synthesis GTPase MnmE [Jannaschia sp. W003]UWQ21990.1 tRNA uridine-5-carboxymethylaminomethyl(34) synthesis GTPase MnmE [Jannaschia sp. W003]